MLKFNIFTPGTVGFILKWPVELENINISNTDATYVCEALTATCPMVPGSKLDIHTTWETVVKNILGSDVQPGWRHVEIYLTTSTNLRHSLTGRPLVNPVVHCAEFT